MVPKKMQIFCRGVPPKWSLASTLFGSRTKSRLRTSLTSKKDKLLIGKRRRIGYVNIVSSCRWNVGLASRWFRMCFLGNCSIGGGNFSDWIRGLLTTSVSTCGYVVSNKNKCVGGSGGHGGLVCHTEGMHVLCVFFHFEGIPLPMEESIGRNQSGRSSIGVPTS